MFFYLLFPLVAPRVLSLSLTVTWVIRAACLVACVALGVLGAVYQPNTFEQPNNLVAWFTYIFPVSRLAEFIFGLTLVQAVRGHTIKMSKLSVSMLLVVAYFAASLNPAGMGLAAATLIPLGLFLVVFCQADASGVPSILHTPFLVRLGEISYCFYLVHHIALRLAAHFVGGTIPGATVVLAFPVAVAAAWWLHERVEKPFDTRLNGRSRASVLNR
jgi:peptidoglycan/LPS O-acetylase OafA/YrhL